MTPKYMIFYIINSMKIAEPVSLTVPGKIAGGAVGLAALLAVVAVRFRPSLDLRVARLS